MSKIMNRTPWIIDMSQCTAKSKRSGCQCLKWAVREKRTCHMHGGTSRGPMTREGRERSRMAGMKHGQYTKEAMAEYAMAVGLLKGSLARVR